jgi:hypothetical protein
MLGSAVTAAFMLLLMALAIIIGAYVFIYAAHRFFAIVQETAAGVDEVHYPADPLMDRLPRAAYLAGLLAICMVPAGFLLKLSPDVALGGSPLLTFFVAATVILWLLFPIVLLSALSASSPWIVFRLTVLRFLLRHAPATFLFYTVSALLAAGCFGLLALAFDRGSWLLILITPFVGSAAFLIYARLLGRMAYLFDQSPRRKRRRHPALGTQASDPWAGSEEPVRKRKKLKQTKSARGEDPWTEPGEEQRKKKKGRADRTRGYVMAENETNPEEVKQPAAKEFKMPTGYRVSDEPLPSAPKELPLDGYVPVGYEPNPIGEETGDEPAPPTDSPMVSDFERRYSQRVEETSPPARPLFSGIYSFPWYMDNLPVWLVLAMAGVAISGLIQVCLGLKDKLGN